MVYYLPPLLPCAYLGLNGASRKPRKRRSCIREHLRHPREKHGSEERTAKTKEHLLPKLLLPGLPIVTLTSIDGRSATRTARSRALRDDDAIGDLCCVSSMVFADDVCSPVPCAHVYIATV